MLSFITSLAAAAVTPAAYYRFENVSDPTIDTMKLCALEVPAESGVTPEGHANVTGVSVGSYLDFGMVGLARADAVPVPKAPGFAWRASTCAPRASATGLTIEFLLSPTEQCFLRGGSADLLRSTDGSIKFQIAFSGMTWTALAHGDPTAPGPSNGTLAVPFTGEGVLAADYLWTGKTAKRWHHVALVRDATSGRQEIWIDGENQPSMRTNLSADNASRAGHMSGWGLLIDESNPIALCAGIDELAIFEAALSPSLIYAHYTDAITHRVPYRTTDPGGAVPNTTYPDMNNVSYYDLNEYPQGSVLPSPGDHYPHAPHPGGGPGGTVCDGCMSCLDQLTFAPDPRFDAASLTTYKTPYNFNWMDPWTYMAGKQVPSRELFNVTQALMIKLATRWRYGYMLSPRYINETIATANAHPEWPLHAVVPGERGPLVNSSLPKGCYMQDAHGKFITILGDPIPAGQPLTLRAMSAATAAKQGCPDSIFNAEGATYRKQFHFDTIAKQGRLTRPFDLINSDGEVFISLMAHRTPAAPGEYYDYSKDSVCAADYAASGAPNWETYFSMWRTRLTNGFSDTLLAPYRATIFKGTKFSMYQVRL